MGFQLPEKVEATGRTRVWSLDKIKRFIEHATLDELRYISSITHSRIGYISGKVQFREKGLEYFKRNAMKGGLANARRIKALKEKAALSAVGNNNENTQEKTNSSV